MGRSKKNKKFLLSIVIPVYNEKKLIKKSISEIKKVLEKQEYSYEFVLVDDGSTDGSWKELVELSSETKNFKAIKLSRNFGKEAALCAGLDKAQGDAVVVMDADLQHPPKTIPKMVKLWLSGDYDVIDGIKKEQGGNRFFANTFYNLFKKLAGFDLKDASDFKLLDIQVVEAWRSMPERETFFRAMSFWIGFRRSRVYFTVPKRLKGSSKWSLFKLFKLALGAITSFSPFPLHLVTFAGWLFFAASVILAIQTLYMRIMGLALDGFTTVILLILITGSLLMISLGIIGAYIAKIYEEVKRRPRYIVSETLEGKK